jgi:hypothetical protein
MIWRSSLFVVLFYNNRGTETQQSASDFDANGNLLGLNNIGNLEWHYNNIGVVMFVTKSLGFVIQL